MSYFRRRHLGMTNRDAMVAAHIKQRLKQLLEACHSIDVKNVSEELNYKRSRLLCATDWVITQYLQIS